MELCPKCGHELSEGSKRCWNPECSVDIIPSYSQKKYDSNETTSDYKKGAIKDEEAEVTVNEDIGPVTSTSDHNYDELNDNEVESSAKMKLILLKQLQTTKKGP